MAALISKASGNFTASTTWYLVDSTSLLDSEAGYSVLDTTYANTRSAAFTPGAITIDGIAVKLRGRAASPSGTVSIQLWNSTDSVAVTGTEVTLNVSDLPSVTTAGTTLEGGWIFFKFSSPVTLEAAHNYNVQAKISGSAQVNLYCNATTDNLSRMLRTTTEQAPAAGDQCDIMGEHTGAGTGNSFTVTMDNVAATPDIGSGTDGATAMTICKRGTLSYGTTAATNYYLKCSGNIIVYNGGELDIGTTGTPIPRDSTAVLEFDPVADGGMGLIVRNGATFNSQGLSRTSGKNVVACKLSADEAAAQTVLSVNTDTGWKSGDRIIMAGTARNTGHTEDRTLGSDASATELTVSSGITNAHQGSSPIYADVILLTRNVRIRSVSSTIMSYVYIQGTSAVVDCDWTEFYYLGENAAGKYGIVVCPTSAASGSANFQYCSFHENEDYGIYYSSSTSTTIQNCVGYKMNTGSTYYHFYNISGDELFSNNVIIIGAGGGYGLSLLTTAHVSNITVCSGTGYGIGQPYGEYSNCLFYCMYRPFVVDVTYPTTNDALFTSCSFIRNGTGFGTTGTGTTGSTGTYTFNSCTWLGEGVASFELGSSNSTLKLWNNYTFNDCTFNGEASYTTPYLAKFGSTGSGFHYHQNIQFNNCSLGGTTAFTTATFHLGGSCTFVEVQLYLNNCLIGNATVIENLTKMTPNSFVKCTKYNQTAGSHKTWVYYGVIESDSTAGEYRTAAPSMKITPSSASIKVKSSSFKVNVNSGQAATPSVYVQHIAAYNGNFPRLILKQNNSIGITADTVIATGSASGHGSFEQLTAATAAASGDGVMEFYVDCDGTAGYIMIDDFSATVA